MSSGSTGGLSVKALPPWSDLKVLEALLEHSEHPLAFLDRDFNFVRVNRAYAEGCRRRPEELVGRNHFELFPHPENEAIFAGVRDTGKAAVWREKPFVFPDMPERGVTYWDWTLAPFKDEKGRVEGLVFSLREVTDKVLARKRIEESEELNRKIIESSSDCIKVLDLEGRLLSMSAGGQRLLEIEDFEPYRGASWVDFWQGAERRAAAEAVARARAGETGRFEGYCPTVKGVPKWWEVVISPIRDELGLPARLVAISRDLTVRRQQEAALRKSALMHDALIRTTRLGYWLTDMEGKLLEANEAYALLSGHQRSDLVGMHVSDLEARESPEEVREHIERVRRDGYSQFETCHRRKDGTTFDVEIRTTYLDVDGGRLMVFVDDISERKQAEMELARHLAAAADANEAKDLFFNTLSHELRTPLAAMLNSIEVLKNPNASRAQCVRVVSLLERNVRHQTRLIDDLLDLSRIMRKKVELVRQPLDLRELVSAQVEALEPGARKGRVTVSVEVAARPVVVMGDADRLGQVVSNLLSNAIKFTEAQGHVTATVRREGNQAVVGVKDTGVGIAPELLPHLFEAFRQAESPLVRSKGGLGIGLAVARSLAELHGGSLEGSSRGPGCGSEFVLRLPLCSAEAPRPSTGPASESAAKSLRVLVVEDGADLRETLTVLLELMGHEVVAVADGAAALQVAGRERPDVALVDIGLPDIDGYEVARRLRADSAARNLRLVALTGFATPEHRERALQAGFDRHLSKPVDAEALRKVLEG